jgi:hypothetical protein
MKGKKQKISTDTCQVDYRSATENKFEGQTFMGMIENNFTNIEQANY